MTLRSGKTPFFSSECSCLCWLTEKVVFLTGVENAKFKKTVNPGSELLLEVKLLSFRKNFFKFSGKAFSDLNLMATSNFSAMLSI